ncbi:sensor histidine kinase [Nesterenkonia populi]
MLFLILMAAVTAMHAVAWLRWTYILSSLMWACAVGMQFGSTSTALGAAIFISILLLASYGAGWGVRRVLARSCEDRAERLQAEKAREETLRAERSRVARELHDNIGRDLTILAMRADAMSLNPSAAATPEKVKLLGATARSALDDLREMVLVLKRDGALLGEGEGSLFPDEADNLVQEVESHGALVNKVIGGEWADVPRWVRAQLFAIVGEALLNAHKHGQSRSGRVAIKLGAQAHGGQWDIQVENEMAEPFPLAESAYGSSGVGLESMQARSRSVGADFSAGGDASGRWVLWLGSRSASETCARS